MQIRQVMTKDAATCQPKTNLAVVAQLMWERDCGFMPIIDAAGKLTGVVTDRDICIACATRRLLPEQLTADEVMHKDPIHVTRPDDTAEKALATMKQFQVRRLAVVDEDGTLQGVVSMNDIVLASQQKGDPKAADVVATLSAICAHRAPKISVAA